MRFYMICDHCGDKAGFYLFAIIRHFGGYLATSMVVWSIEAVNVNIFCWLHFGGYHIAAMRTILAVNVNIVLHVFVCFTFV